MIKRSSCRSCRLPWKLLQRASCLVAALAAARLEEPWGRAEEMPTNWPAISTTVTTRSPESPAGPYDGFRQLFKLANPDAAQWARFADRTRLATADLPLVMQLLYRLRQVETDSLDRWTQPAPPMSAWLNNPADHQAELAWITGKVRSLEEIEIPDSVTRVNRIKQLYQCQLEMGPQQVPATVIVPKVPTCWLATDTLPQPVRLRGLFLGTLPHMALGQARPALLLLTTHLAWFPVERASPGQVFLAARGMDVALLDEVQQRQPFVKPGLSHESEAFYACLVATDRAGPGELSTLAWQHLPAVANHWRTILSKSNQRRQMLQQEIAAAGKEPSREMRELRQLEQERKAADRRVTLASTVLQRAGQNHYSIAPLFLEPRKQVGCLVMVEGVARRAVKIMLDSDHAAMAATQVVEENGAMKVEDLRAARPEAGVPRAAHQADAKGYNSEPIASTLIIPSGGLEGSACYYELEIFTADSQNMPVVCCVSRVPANFPLGDAIREPVQVAGIFFKSWLYRTRQTKDNNKTGRQQRLSVPIVIGAEVERRPAPSVKTGWWPLVAGIGFLVLLGAFWATMLRHIRRERLHRSSRRPDMELPQQWPDTYEDQSPR